MIRLLPVFVLFVYLSNVLYAQKAEYDVNSYSQNNPSKKILSDITLKNTESDTKGKHHENHYHLSVFAGYTMDLNGKTGPKLGIEYEYRVSEKFGVGGTFDFTGKDFEIFSFSVGADAYLFKFPLIIGAALGAKRSDGKWKPFFRTMAVYDFHFSNFSLGPMIMYDIYFSSKDLISPGITFGIGL